jgi:hypothetical protein
MAFGRSEKAMIATCVKQYPMFLLVRAIAYQIESHWLVWTCNNETETHRDFERRLPHASGCARFKTGLPDEQGELM